MTRFPKKIIVPIIIAAIFLTIVFIGWSNYRLFENRFTTQLTVTESELLSQGNALFSRELGHIRSTTLFLRNSAYALSTTHSHMPNSVWWTSDIIQVFSQFARTSPYISQVRWIDPQGKELIRINSHGGQITVVPTDQLQDKSDRYYVQQAVKAKGNNVYISPVDLNMENDQIVHPLEPTLRGAVSLDRERKGVLVVNYNLTQIFGQLRSLSDNRVYLDVVNPEGEWLISKDPKQEWANALNYDQDKNVLKALYPDVWNSILPNGDLSSLLYKGQVWSSKQVMVEGDSTALSEGSASSLYFIARSQMHVLSEHRTYLLWVIISLSSVAFLVLSFLVWWQMGNAYKRRDLLVALEQEKSHLKIANEELNKINRQLVELQNELVERSKLSALGLMVAGLAHEMNTPLGGVRMAISSLAALINREVDQLSNKSKSSMMTSIEIANKNLTRTVNLVASFKRITSDATGQDIETFLFNDVLKDVLIVYKSLLKRHTGIEIIHECESNINMKGFPGILFQVIQNFIDNALQHGFKDVKRGTITLIAKSHEGCLVLTIEDNGKGISDEVVDRLFDPFVTTGRGEKHTGLGLHLVHQWVYQLMNGHIEVTSKKGEGTRFVVFIPLIHSREITNNK